MQTKYYLGDSVYAEIDGDVIILTTEHAISSKPSNVIYLESGVIIRLITLVNKLKEKKG